MSGGGALQRVLGALERVGSRWRHQSGGYMAQCPAHDDQTASLKVTHEDGKALLWCHTGCSTDTVAQALGLTMADLFDTNRDNPNPRKPEIVATYDYHAADGTFLFQKVRMVPKTFRVRRPDGRGGWTWSIGDAPRVLYRLPAVLAAITAGETVFLVEGEADADRIVALGHTATCNFDGASKDSNHPKWRDDYSDALLGANVVIIADNDEPGLAHARAAAASMQYKATSVRLVRGAVSEKHADISDHLDAGLTLDEVIDIPFTKETASDATAPSEPPLEPSADGVPEPTRVTRKHHPAPIHCLPIPLGDWVSTVAGFVQTVPEMAMLAALASVSYVTGGNAVINIRGHREPLTIWAGGCALPSERKSSVLNTAAKQPLGEAVAMYWEEHATSQQKIRHLISVAEKKITRLETAMASAQPPQDGADQITRAIDTLNELKSQVISRPVWAVTDSTVEGLETLMAQEGGAVASFADEAALLSTISGRYSSGRGISLSSMNQAWSGGTIHVLRQGGTREVQKPHLVMCQLIQPEPFARFMGALRAEQDGFLSRWLYVDMHPYGPRKVSGAPLEEEAHSRWVKTLHALLHRFWGAREPIDLELSQEAWPRYESVFAEIDADVRAHAATNGTFAQWLGKAANGHVLRIAALFELISDTEARAVSLDSLDRAVTLYRWLRDEALAAMTATSGEVIQSEVERELLTWIAARRAKDRVAGRDPMQFIQARYIQAGLRRFRHLPKEDAEAALVQLEDQMWLRRTDSAGRTDAAMKWQIRPDFEEKWTP